MTSSTHPLTVRNLVVQTDGTARRVVDDVSFDLMPGDSLGLVGESGSGKTTVAHASLGYSRKGLNIVSGTVQVGGEDILRVGEKKARSMRGKTIAYIPQNPGASLNPAHKIGKQFNDLLAAHGRDSRKPEYQARITKMLTDVALGNVRGGVLGRYPHELSGGQQQRVVIGLALLLEPLVIVADEPTTGLDVSTQKHVLSSLHALLEERGISLLYISHDLAIVSQLCARVAVMYQGKVIEEGTRAEVFGYPRHPYTRALLDAVPSVDHPLSNSARSRGVTGGPCDAVARATADSRTGLTGRDDGQLADRRHSAHETPILEIQNISASYGHLTVLSGVGFDVRSGECVGVAGESGSGKTTLARCIIGLHNEMSGQVRYKQQELPRIPRKRIKAARKDIQFIFQSPYESLNSKWQVGRILRSRLDFFSVDNETDTNRRIESLLQDVSLDSSIARMHPAQLSGGQRQRVSIARALAAEPQIIICDEITSSLDVSVQAEVIRLLQKLRAERDLTLIFITHNLGVLRSLADRVLIMQHGEVVELGPTTEVLSSPREGYTQRLLADLPRLERGNPSYHDIEE